MIRMNLNQQRSLIPNQRARQAGLKLYQGGKPRPRHVTPVHIPKVVAHGLGLLSLFSELVSPSNTHLKLVSGESDQTSENALLIHSKGIFTGAYDLAVKAIEIYINAMSKSGYDQYSFMHK